MGNGLGAIAKVPALGWGQIVAYCAACEISGMSNRSDAPGDFGWKVLTSSDPEEKNKKLAAEIANGRLAMMAIIGMFFQDGLTGSAWGDWASYTASPLRARGGARGGFDMTVEPGALPPLGFWDPCGFSKTDAEFKEYRGKELKHGRVAMMATFGMIVQHYWKLSACKDVPAGVQAATEYPGSVGLGFLFLVTGFFEMNILADFEDKENPGNFSDPLRFQENVGQYNEKWRNFEIQNGRMAMIGIIGTMTAGWYTGYDAVEQWTAAKPTAIAFIKTTIPFAP